TVNPFAEKGIWGILFWLLTFAVTGFNQDIFPNSNIAKISSVIIPILAVLGAFFIVIHQSIQKDRYNEKQLKGEVTPNLNNHIIICGWNNRVPAIIRNLLSQSAPDLSHKILVVAEVDEEKPLEKYGLDKRKVHFYRGISSSHKVLQAADIERSFCSIIVADDKKVQQGNFRSVFTASAIRELTKKKEYYPIIAEVFYQDNIHYFKDYDVQRLLCLKSYTIRFLSHAIINPGVSDILLNLLAFDPPYQLAKVSAQKYGIDKKTYAASVELLRKKDILLLGVYQESKGIVHDPLELEFREDSPYFTNPIPGELETTIAMDDHLIILKNVPGGHSDNDSIQQKELFTAVNCNQETILVIGGHDIATNLCAQISNKVNRVIQLKLNEAEPWTYDDDVFHLDKGSNFDIYETNNLLSILNDTRAPLMDVTRILALTPNPKVNNHLSSVYQDDEVLKIITILKHHFKDKQQAAPHIAAEIKDMSNKELFYYANVNQLVPTNQLIEHVISRMVFHSGKVSGFILKAMSYHQNNKLVRIEKWAAHKLVQKVDRPLIGSTYDEILLYCLPKGIQLMAIETTTETGSKDVIINPDTKSSDSTRGLDLADKVFVLVRTQH
ncbi:MAG: Trk K+ transport system NAD-binding subunit, partial [Phenylobacterium sp.]